MEINKQEDKAYAKALNRISYRPRSAFEIKTFLKREFPTELIDKIIEKLERQKYLDDHQFASWFAQSKINQLHGPLLIRNGLKEKGIDPGLINRVIDELLPDPETIKELAQKLIQKKHLHLDNLKERYKATQYLLRRGFPGSLFHRLFNEPTELDTP